MKTKFTPKLENRAEVCMFVEYFESTMKEFMGCGMKPNVIHVSQDVVWLKQIFFAKKEDEE